MKRDDLTKGFNSRCIYAGQSFDPTTNAVVMPIYATSTFAHTTPGQHTGFDYGRAQNPTRFALERLIASLESGSAGFAFASGQAAAATIVDLLPAGSHIIATDDIYSGTYRIFDMVRHKSAGMSTSYVDLNDPAKLKAALRPKTRMIWVETPTNPLLKLFDIQEIVKFARSHGLQTVVDNTFATPWIHRPLELGVDIVMHSGTKYIGGHSDVIGGLVVTNDPALDERMKFLQNALGAVSGPFDSFLMHRGLKTLGLRMQRHSENALALATWLESHPKVARVIYPGLKSHPQYELATRQMQRGFGGMIGLELKGDSETVRRFLLKCRIFTLAISLGGVESLIEQPSTMTHSFMPKEAREAAGISDGMVRISVGIEDADDLRADLEQALAD